MNDIYVLGNSQEQEVGIQYLNIFDINFINQSLDFSKYDALIFTSKNAIYSLENFNINYKSIPSYAISNKTANILKKYNSNSVYTGKSSNGNDFANEIKSLLEHKNVLYIRAKKVVSNLQNILNDNNIKCDDVVVYETLCKKYKNDKKPKPNAKIIFTSPSSIKCFFKSFVWDESYRAICIGETTASYLPNNIKYIVPEILSIEECIKVAKNI